MAELTAADVEAFTHGELVDGDDETDRALAAALAQARRYCGWHVCPVRTDDEIVVDGSGRIHLPLPTQNLISLTAVVEDGVVLDVNDLVLLPRGSIIKRSSTGHGVRWTPSYAGVEVTMTHGYTETEAADWRSAVLSSIDRVSTGVGGGREVIGPFQYGGSNAAAAFTEYERAILDSYRLETVV